MENGIFHVNDQLVHNIFVSCDSTHAKPSAHDFAERVQSDYTTVGVEGEERRGLFVQEVQKAVGIILDNQEVVFPR